MNAPLSPASSLAAEPRLTSLSHGGGCGCKIAPGVLSEILKGTTGMPIPPQLLVGIETADDAAVYQLNDEQALIATTDFFMPIVDDPYDFGRIAATNAISDVYAMGGRPIMALALVGMPISVLSTTTIGRILEGGQAVCRAAGIPIAGGHTIDSVEPIYGLVALGLVHPKHVKRNADARPGDRLVLGKPLGVGVLSAALKKEQLDAAGYARKANRIVVRHQLGEVVAVHIDKAMIKDGVYQTGLARPIVRAGRRVDNLLVGEKRAERARELGVRLLVELKPTGSEAEPDAWPISRDKFDPNRPAPEPGS